MRQTWRILQARLRKPSIKPIISPKKILRNLMYLLHFLVPQSHLEQVKEAIFAAGAGRVDNYQDCTWQTKGEGQFMPLAGSHPFIGEINQLETVIEYKVETICSDECIGAAVAALKKAHPYESPSYTVLRMETEF